MARDAKRQEVYGAEFKAWYGLDAASGTVEIIGRVEGRRLIRNLCAILEIEPVAVKPRAGGANSFYRHDGRDGKPEIKMLPCGKGWNKATLLHEFAHHVVHQRFGARLGVNWSHQAHGPEFVAILASLFVLVGDRPPVNVVRALSGLIDRQTSREDR